MKVLSAKDYGHRKVIQVVMDDTLPKWVHADGTAAPKEHSGDTADEATKTMCPDCRLNWVIQEYPFEGDDLKKDGVAKTDEELIDEALTKAAASVVVPADMAIPAAHQLG